MKSTILTLLKTKALIFVVAIALVIGGATAVLAATALSQNAPHTFAHNTLTGTVTPGHKADSDQNDDQNSQRNGQTCDDGNGASHATPVSRNEKDCDDGSSTNHPTATATPRDD